MIQFVSRSSWRCDVPTVNCSPSTTIAQCPAELTHFSLLLMTGPQPFPQRILRRVRCNAASFNLQNFLLSFRSSSSCQCFVLRLSILHSIFLSITWCVRQFLRKIWPIQLTFLLCIVFRVFPPFLPLSIFHTIDTTDHLHPSPAPHFETFNVLSIYFPQRPSFSTALSSAPNVALYWFLLLI